MPSGLPSMIVVAVIAGLAASVITLAMSRRRLAADLAATRQLFSRCMDLAPFAAYIKDVDGRYLYENPALVECTRRGMSHVTSFLGRTDLDVFPADHARQYMDDDREVMRQGKPIAFDNSSVDADGTIHQWFSVKFPWIDEHGRSCVAGMSVDLSAVRRAEEHVKASEDRCALALEAGQMGSMSLDLATLMLDTSPVFARLHGRPETATRLGLEESLAEVHPDDRSSIMQAIQAAREDRAPRRIAYRVVRPDGEISWIELVGRVYADERGRPVVVRGVAFDVTERRAAFEELARRRDMLRRLIEVQENERQTLCHELHDGMMQYAIGAKMLLEAVHEETQSAAHAERIAAAIDCVERGIAEGRQVIRGVRSAVLDDLGLAAAIHDLADQMAAHGITVDVSLDDDLEALPPDLQTTVYRVVQESLANVRKHAAVDRASVTVRRTPIEVRVQVSDTGTGFDVTEARRRGFGLVGMTERVRLAGGTCTIESRPGGGSRVGASLPVSGAAAPPVAEDGESRAYAAAPVLAPR